MGDKLKYYKIGFPQNSIYGLGVPENKEDEWFQVPCDGKITDWKPITLKLKDGLFSDYQGSNPVCRLCSAKLRSIIDNLKSPTDEIQWLPMFVKNEYGEEREYFILHFPVVYDVIDRNRSIIVEPDHIVKPVFSLKKLGEHKVFNYYSSNFIGFIVSEDIKKEVEKEKCTNLVFSKAPLVD